MPIGGFIKTSLVDYPGKVAATVFFTNCNFFCPFCQNPALVLDSGVEHIPFGDIMDYLEKSRNKLIDAVCFSGGEPTLAPELPEYIRRVKELGLLVKLDTNGSNPHVLEALPLDYVAMDIKTSLRRYHELTRLPHIEETMHKSIDILLHADRFDYEFRTTLVPGFVGEKELQEIGNLITGARRWFLQPFRTVQTLDTTFESVKPYTEEVVFHLLKVAREFVPHAELRK